MKSTIQLTNEVVNSLQIFNKSEKSISDRIALRAALFSVVAEIKETMYEGELLELPDDSKLYLCEELIPELIPLIGKIESHVTSVCSSGCIGYTILSDSYEPARFVKF